jgi:hypothetical protein
VRITLVLIGSFAFLGVGILAFSGYVQGEFETVPEGVTWMRALLEDGVLS